MTCITADLTLIKTDVISPVPRGRAHQSPPAHPLRSLVGREKGTALQSTANDDKREGVDVDNKRLDAKHKRLDVKHAKLGVNNA